MLLNRPPPYPDEAFTSWLWRLAERNYTASLKGLLRSVLSLRQLQAQEPREPAVFRALAALTHTSIETVHAHTLHRFAHLLTAPEAQAAILDCPTENALTLAPVRPNRDFFTSGFAWCPACLSEAQYVRLHWHVPVVVSCVIHHCWLLEACPGCHGRISEADVVRGRCAGCGLVPEQAQAVSIPPDDLLLELQREMLSWLYEQKTSGLTLPTAPVGVLLRVLYGLRFSVQRAGSSWNFHYAPVGVPAPQVDILEQRALSVFERGCLYATAFRGLLDWPHGFYRFLDAYRARPAPREKTGLRSEFGTLYISWLQRLWKHPAFDFIQQAFNDYLLEQIPVPHIAKSLRVRDYPDLLDRVRCVDLKRARQLLDCSVYTVYRLVGEGHLTLTHCPADSTGVWFDRQQLFRLKTESQQHLSLTATARQLGVSKRLTGELLEAHLLQRVSPKHPLKHREIVVQRRSLGKLLRRLRTFTTIQPLNEQSVPLLTVCIRNGVRGVDQVFVLNRILAGRLPAFHPDNSLLSLKEFWFRSEDVERMVAENGKLKGSDASTTEKRRL